MVIHTFSHILFNVKLGYEVLDIASCKMHISSITNMWNADIEINVTFFKLNHILLEISYYYFVFSFCIIFNSFSHIYNRYYYRILLEFVFQVKVVSKKQNNGYKINRNLLSRSEYVLFHLRIQGKNLGRLFMNSEFLVT